VDIRVKDVAESPDQDINLSDQVDARKLDAFVFTCVAEAKEALKNSSLQGYSDFDRDRLMDFMEGFRQSHLAMRKIIAGEQGGWAVDALVIARLQLESVYTLCYLLECPANVVLFLKNGWKKKYVRFLLEREERKTLPRFQEYLDGTAPKLLENLRKACSVTDEEKLTIELEELKGTTGTGTSLVRIEKFPTPMGVIDRIAHPERRRLLKRLYPEYQYLCSFAHGDAEASMFRTLSDTRSPARHVMSSEATKDFYQRQVIEPPVLYSALCSVQAATEIADLFRTNVELMVKVSEAWSTLANVHFLSRTLWNLRAKQVVPSIG
jgi:hypothetical protein